SRRLDPRAVDRGWIRAGASCLLRGEIPRPNGDARETSRPLGHPYELALDAGRPSPRGNRPPGGATGGGIAGSLGLPRPGGWRPSDGPRVAHGRAVGNGPGVRTR